MAGNWQDIELAKQIIYDYLKRENRPFGINDVHNNLQQSWKEIKEGSSLSKTLVTKAIDALVEEETVISKDFGKTRVVWINQTEQSCTAEDLAELEMKHATLMETIANKKAQIQTAQNNLNARENKPKPLSEIKKENLAKTKTIKDLEDKVKELEGKSEGFNMEEFEQIKKRRDYFVGEWRKRKRLAMKIVGTIAESGGLSTKDVIKIVKIDTDEDNDVHLPED